MEQRFKLIRTICGIWLLLLCVLTFPWGLVYSAPVLLAYAVTRRRSWCSQVAMVVGCVSLLFSVYLLVSYILWKAAGNFDAQEPLTLVFIAIWQYLISAAAMLVTRLFCAGYRNLSSHEGKTSCSLTSHRALKSRNTVNDKKPL